MSQILAMALRYWSGVLLLAAAIEGAGAAGMQGPTPSNSAGQAGAGLESGLQATYFANAVMKEAASVFGRRTSTCKCPCTVSYPLIDGLF